MMGRSLALQTGSAGATLRDGALLHPHQESRLASMMTPMILVILACAIFGVAVGAASGALLWQTRVKL